MRLKLLLVLFAWLPCMALWSQSRVARKDTVAYKVGYYDIKKQTKVFLVAEKLNVNPDIIVTLNKFRNIEQNLYKDQRIKIPVYPRGYKYQPEKETAPVSAPPTLIEQITVQPSNDTSAVDEDAMPLAPDIQQIKSEQEYKPTSTQLGEPAVEHKPVEGVVDTHLITEVVVPEQAPVVVEDVVPTVSTDVPVTPTLQPSENPSEDSATLELMDVMLELNEAILAGTIASIDSIDAEDASDLSEGNVEDVLRRMRKARNRVLLRPELLTIRDSLTLDIANQKMERSKVIARLEEFNRQQELRKAEEARKAEEQLLLLAQASQPIPVKQSGGRKSNIVTGPAMPVFDNEADKEKKRKAEPLPLDTIIVIDLEPWKAIKSEKSFAYETHPVLGTDIKTNNAITIDAPVVQEKKIDTAVIVSKPEKFESDTAFFASIKEATRIADSVANANRDRKLDANGNPVVISGTVQRQPGGGTQQKIVPHFAATVTEQDYRQYYSSNTPEYLIPVDTVRRVKAEFFLRRAEKSLEEKNLKNTQQYLKKSLELNPNYFDAWLMSADLEAMYGSQTKAMKHYEICSKIDSTQHRLWYKMAGLNQLIKHRKDALDCYNKAIEIIPNDVLSRMSRAAILSDMKQYDKSLDDYNYITQINPAYAYVYKARGIVYHLNKNFELAIQDFNTFLAIEKKPDASVYYYRGLSKLATNQLLDGCLDLSKASGYGYKAADKAIAKSCE